MGGCDEEIANENKVARVREEGGERGNMVRIAKRKIIWDGISKLNTVEVPIIYESDINET